LDEDLMNNINSSSTSAPPSPLPEQDEDIEHEEYTHDLDSSQEAVDNETEAESTEFVFHAAVLHVCHV
jgi:hypothetical protein